ncbi:MAG: methyltransferase domain-containing protein [Cyanobacteria bacterium P01_H01_bin.58]
MFKQDTDREWEKYGKEDPYYGVITCEKFCQANLNKASKEEFFASGSKYIDKIIDNVRQHLNQDCVIERALDFGCGVGRLVMPLAKISKEVTGIDVSESMLNEARKNCAESSIENVRFVKSDDNLSCLNSKYDFIHSFIVFQHIPPLRGEKIFRQLLSHLEDGGIGVIHFTYKKANRVDEKIVYFLRNNIPFASSFISILRGKGLHVPQMQMNTYNLNRVLSIMQETGVRNFYTEFTQHANVSGVIFYFKKSQLS